MGNRRRFDIQTGPPQINVADLVANRGAPGLTNNRFQRKEVYQIWILATSNTAA